MRPGKDWTITWICDAYHARIAINTKLIDRQYGDEAKARLALVAGKNDHFCNGILHRWSSMHRMGLFPSWRLKQIRLIQLNNCFAADSSHCWIASCVLTLRLVLASAAPLILLIGGSCIARPIATMRRKKVHSAYLPQTHACDLTPLLAGYFISLVLLLLRRCYFVA